MEEISVETQVLEIVYQLRLRLKNIDETLPNDDLEDLHYWVNQLEELFVGA